MGKKKKIWKFFLIGCKSQGGKHQRGSILSSYRQLDCIYAVAGAASGPSETWDLT